MKTFLSWLIRFLRNCLYNTPVRNWRVVALIYSRMAQFQIGNVQNPLVSFEGIKLKTDGKDGIMTSGLMNGIFERFTLRIFRELIQEALEKAGVEDLLFADVGANIGVFSAIAAQMGQRVKVFSFEPNPISYKLLVENITLNEFINVTPMNVAVGAEKGTASLDISSHSAALYSIHGKGKKRVDVSLVSLDSYFSAQGAFPKLIKMDVEGYEPFVLQGMKNILLGGPLQIILEFNPELLKQGGKVPSYFLAELVRQFDHVYCLDENDQKLVRYEFSNIKLTQKICSLGYNLLLINGQIPGLVKAHI